LQTPQRAACGAYFNFFFPSSFCDVPFPPLIGGYTSNPFFFPLTLGSSLAMVGILYWRPRESPSLLSLKRSMPPILLVFLVPGPQSAPPSFVDSLPLCWDGPLKEVPEHSINFPFNGVARVFSGILIPHFFFFPSPSPPLVLGLNIVPSWLQLFSFVWLKTRSFFPPQLVEFCFLPPFFKNNLLCRSPPRKCVKNVFSPFPRFFVERTFFPFCSVSKSFFSLLDSLFCKLPEVPRLPSA